MSSGMQFRSQCSMALRVVLVALLMLKPSCLATPATAFVTQPRPQPQPQGSRRRHQHQQRHQPKCVSKASGRLVLASSTPSEGVVADIGYIKTITKPGPSDQRKVQLGDIVTVKYTCYLPDNPKASPFARSEKQKMVVGDGTMIKGWERALRTMTVGERAIIRITDPELGYGAKGVPPFIPPNAPLEFDVEVLDTQLPTANIDFDSLANADNTPRTASAIQAAYEERQALKALDAPAREGLQGFLDKAKNFYFFGFFEGETGEKAPWFLRPSITFPIAFLIVGAAFYVSILSGAITERGASVTDELDEVILSSILSTASGDSTSRIGTTLVAVLFSSLDGGNGGLV